MSLPIGLTKAFYALLRAGQLSESKSGITTTIRCTFVGCGQQWMRVETEHKCNDRAWTATDRRVAALHVAEAHPASYQSFVEAIHPVELAIGGAR